MLKIITSRLTGFAFAALVLAVGMCCVAQPTTSTEIQASTFRTTEIIQNAANLGTSPHASYQLNVSGTNYVGADGGFQVFQTTGYDTTGGPAQSIAGYFQNACTQQTGAGGLVNYAILSLASGGTANYSFYGGAGSLHNADASSFGSTLDVAGLLRPAAGLTVPNGSNPVTLGDDVSGFKMPNGATAALIVGKTSTIPNNLGTIQIVNTGAQRFSSFGASGDTTANAAALPAFQLFRGAGGGSFRGAFEVDDGSAVAANDVLIYYDSSPLDFYSGTGALALQFTQKNHVVAGGGTAPPGLSAGCTSGGGSAIVGNDFLFKLTTGATSTACTLTFAGTYGTASICTVYSEGGIANPTCTISATAITCTTNLPASVYNWHCGGAPGAS